jgi:Ca2+:H+ antiporter
VPFEVAAIVIAIFINKIVLDKGQSYWITGVFLLGVYLILAMGFFYLPM